MTPSVLPSVLPNGSSVPAFGLVSCVSERGAGRGGISRSGGAIFSGIVVLGSPGFTDGVGPLWSWAYAAWKSVVEHMVTAKPSALVPTTLRELCPIVLTVPEDEP
jgi:hypothetical protein